MSWVRFSLLMVLFGTVNALLRKRITIFKSFDPMVAVFWLGFVMVSISFFVQLSRRKPLVPDSGMFVWCVALGVVFFFFQLCMWKGILTAPNPGFVLAILQLSLPSVCIVSVFMFGSEFTPRQGLGVVMVVVGVMLLAVDKEFFLALLRGG